MQGTIRNTDTLSMMIASDLHLGYAEGVPERQDDSFTCFEEILKLCQGHNVDILLLGGDLFHDRRPSHVTLCRTESLLTKYCFGDKPIEVNLLTGQEEIVGGSANFLNENLNISLPIFTINGNHDEPTGANRLSPLDILSRASLLNYIGKLDSAPNEITLKPVVLQKGATILCLFGLGYLNDTRMHKLFDDNRIKMELPQGLTPSDVFSILMLHQSRQIRGGAKSKNFICLDHLQRLGMVDLAVWGHEHQSEVLPKVTPEIIQPGSPVATAMHVSNVGQKYVTLLEVNRQMRKIVQIPLLTSRMFQYKTVSLADLFADAAFSRPSEAQITTALKNTAVEFLDIIIEERNTIRDREIEKRAIARFPEELREVPAHVDLPLLRIKVDFGDLPLFSPKNLNAEFVGIVQNSTDLFDFTCKPKQIKALTKSDLKGGARIGLHSGLNLIDYVKLQMCKRLEQNPGRKPFLRTHKATDFISTLSAFVENDVWDSENLFRKMIINARQCAQQVGDNEAEIKRAILEKTHEQNVEWAQSTLDANTKPIPQVEEQQPSAIPMSASIPASLSHHSVMPSMDPSLPPIPHTPSITQSLPPPLTPLVDKTKKKGLTRGGLLPRKLPRVDQPSGSARKSSEMANLFDSI
ncbi:hypothetical protein RCL1_005758 [Eukaryota sp. TZLM3-RCL]